MCVCVCVSLSLFSTSIHFHDVPISSHVVDAGAAEEEEEEDRRLAAMCHEIYDVTPLQSSHWQPF